MTFSPDGHVDTVMFDLTSDNLPTDATKRKPASHNVAAGGLKQTRRGRQKTQTHKQLFNEFFNTSLMNSYLGGTLPTEGAKKGRPSVNERVPENQGLNMAGRETVEPVEQDAMPVPATCVGGQAEHPPAKKQRAGRRPKYQSREVSKEAIGLSAGILKSKPARTATVTKPETSETAATTQPPNHAVTAANLTMPNPELETSTYTFPAQYTDSVTGTSLTYGSPSPADGGVGLVSHSDHSKNSTLPQPARVPTDYAPMSSVRRRTPIDRLVKTASHSLPPISSLTQPMLGLTNKHAPLYRNKVISQQRGFYVPGNVGRAKSTIIQVSDASIMAGDANTGMSTGEVISYETPKADSMPAVEESTTGTNLPQGQLYSSPT